MVERFSFRVEGKRVLAANFVCPPEPAELRETDDANLQSGDEPPFFIAEASTNAAVAPCLLFTAWA